MDPPTRKTSPGNGDNYLLIDQSIDWQIILALLSRLLYCSGLFSVPLPRKRSALLPQKSCRNNSQQHFVFTPNQSLHPDRISALHTSLSTETQLYSRKRSTMLSTQYIIQVYKSPQRRLSVSGCVGWGRKMEL